MVQLFGASTCSPLAPLPTLPTLSSLPSLPLSERPAKSSKFFFLFLLWPRWLLASRVGEAAVCDLADGRDGPRRVGKWKGGKVVEQGASGLQVCV